MGENGARIIKTEVPESNERSIEKKVIDALSADPAIRAVFVTSSRVHLVAKLLASSGEKNVLLMGYDFLPANVSCLQKGMIDFLICQKPRNRLTGVL